MKNLFSMTFNAIKIFMVATLLLSVGMQIKAQDAKEPSSHDGKNREKYFSIGYVATSIKSTIDYSKSVDPLLGGKRMATSGFRLGFLKNHIVKTIDIGKFYCTFGIQSGLLYEASFFRNKDFQRLTLDNGYSTKNTKTFAMDHNFSIPVHFVYKFHFTKDLYVFVATGPSVDVDMYTYRRVKTSTHLKLDFPGSMEDNINSTDIDVDNQHTLMGFDLSGNNGWNNCFNLLWDFSTGIQYKFFQLSIGTEVGMINLAEDVAGIKSKAFRNKPICLTLSFQL